MVETAETRRWGERNVEGGTNEGHATTTRQGQGKDATAAKQGCVRVCLCVFVCLCVCAWLPLQCLREEGSPRGGGEEEIHNGIESLRESADHAPEAREEAKKVVAGSEGNTQEGRQSEVTRELWQQRWRLRAGVRSAVISTRLRRSRMRGPGNE